MAKKEKQQKKKKGQSVQDMMGIEILLSKLYARFGITDSTDYSTKRPTDFPIMEDFYKLCEEEFYGYDKQRKYDGSEEAFNNWVIRSEREN